MSEIGNDTTNLSDGAVDGEKLVYAKGTVKKEISNMNETHWTFIGMVAINIILVRCVVIFVGGNWNGLVCRYCWR